VLTLYHHNISVCAQKVRIVLAEKNVPWEGRHLNLESGEHLKPEYLRIHPKGFVPALVHDDYTIIESTLICEYLDDVFPDPPLKPKHPGAVARMRLWPKAVDDGLHFAIGSISHTMAFMPQLKTIMSVAEIEERMKRMPDKARSARQLELLRKGLDAQFVRDALRLYDKSIGEMEAALDNGPWLAGDQFTLADIAVIPYIERLDRLGLSRFWNPARPKVGAWLARMRARPSFAAAITAFAPVGLFTDLLGTQGAELWPQVEKALAD
jgi:glutathione S-transferase